MMLYQNVQSTFAPPIQFSHQLKVTALTFGITIVIFGFFGNLLTIVAIIKTPALRQGPNLFILNLGVADLLFCTLTIPVRLTVFVHNGWIFDDKMCKLHATAGYTLIGTAMMCQVGTAIGRFLRFIWPDAYQRLFKRKKWVVCMTVSCWIAPVLIILPTTFGLWGDVERDEYTHTCKLDCHKNYKQFCHFFLSISLFFPAVVIMFCYLRILRVVCANHRRITIMRVQLRSRQIWHPRAAATQDQREDLKFTVMMLCVFFVFLSCYFPYAIYGLVVKDGYHLTASTATMICAWFSACLNPLVYVVLNSKFRHAIVNMLTCKTDQHVVNL